MSDLGIFYIMYIVCFISTSQDDYKKKIQNRFNYRDTIKQTCFLHRRSLLKNKEIECQRE